MSSEPAAMETLVPDTPEPQARPGREPVRSSVLSSIVFNWSSLIVGAIVSIVLTPIMIRSLGQYYYGMWVLVMAICDQYGLLDLGMTAALLRFAGYFQGAKNRSGLNEIFSITLLLTVIVSIALIVLSTVAASILSPFFSIAAADRGTFSRLVIALGLTTAIAFPERMLAAYLRGIQRFDLFNAAATSALVVRAVLFYVALRLGFGILTIAMITLAMGTASLVAHYLLVRLADPDLRIRLSHLKSPRLRQLFGFGAYAFVTSLGTRLITRLDSIVIGRVLTVSLIAPFNVASRLTDYFVGVFAGVYGPVLSAMSELDGAAKGRELQALFLRTTRYTFLLSLFMGIGLVANGRPFLELWLASSGMDLTLTYQVLVVLTLCYTVNQAQLPSWTVVYARARHQALAWLVLCEGLINVGLSVYWGRRYGLLGIALGTTVPAVLTHLLIVPRYALRVVEIPCSTYLRAISRPLLAGALFGIICIAMGVNGQQSVASLVINGALQLGIFGVLAYFVGLPKEERGAARTRWQRVLTAVRSSRGEHV